jgi:hypothetical protein
VKQPSTTLRNIFIAIPVLISLPGTANCEDCAVTKATGGHTKSSNMHASVLMFPLRCMIVGVIGRLQQE